MLKVTTWNVNGIRARHAEVVDWVAREQPDVLCLQELKAAPHQVPESVRELQGYWHYFHGHKGYSGVALCLSRTAFPRAPVFGHPSFDHETRIVTARVGSLLLASVYVPNGGKSFDDKVRFLDAMADFAADAAAAGTTLLLCGDLNVTREPRDVHPSLQKPTQIGQTEGERAQLERVLAQGLSDVLRAAHPDDDRLFTWWAPWRNHRQRNIGWRLDYVLASHALSARVQRCDAHREFGTSDHAPVTASFAFEVPEVGDEEEAPEPASQPASKGQLTLF